MTKIVNFLFFIFYPVFLILSSTDTVKQDEYILIDDNKGLEKEVIK